MLRQLCIWFVGTILLAGTAGLAVTAVPSTAKADDDWEDYWEDYWEDNEDYWEDYWEWRRDHDRWHRRHDFDEWRYRHRPLLRGRRYFYRYPYRHPYRYPGYRYRYYPDYRFRVGPFRFEYWD